MKIMYYHECFEYQDEYNFKKLGEQGIPVNSKRIVCPTCNGDGNHFRTDLDENLLIQEMFEDGDYDGVEAYENGAFNQVCTHCNGRNVVDDVDWDSMPLWAIVAIDEYEADKELDEQIRRAECGCYY